MARARLKEKGWPHVQTEFFLEVAVRYVERDFKHLSRQDINAAVRDCLRRDPPSDDVLDEAFTALKTGGEIIPLHGPGFTQRFGHPRPGLSDKGLRLWTRVSEPDGWQRASTSQLSLKQVLWSTPKRKLVTFCVAWTLLTIAAAGIVAYAELKPEIQWISKGQELTFNSTYGVEFGVPRDATVGFQVEGAGTVFSLCLSKLMKDLDNDSRIWCGADLERADYKRAVDPGIYELSFICKTDVPCEVTYSLWLK